MSNNSKEHVKDSKEIETHPYKFSIILGYIYVLMLYLSLLIIHNVAFILGLFGFIIYGWYMDKKKDLRVKFHLQVMMVIVAVWVFVYPVILAYAPWEMV